MNLVTQSPGRLHSSRPAGCRTPAVDIAYNDGRNWFQRRSRPGAKLTVAPSYLAVVVAARPSRRNLLVDRKESPMAGTASPSNKRVTRYPLATLALVLAGALAIAACGTPAEGPAGTSAEPASGTGATLRVAAVFETPIEEPWVNQIHVALVKAKEEMGIEYTWSESVKSADFARVMREYAEGGYQLIMGDSFGAERIARRVAADYPDVAFVFGSGIGPAEPNFAVFDNWIHEPAYLAGMIAGKMTTSNTIGVVAAMPIPEVNRITNAFLNGAREVNPDVKAKVAFIGSFFDPPKAKEAALAQVEAGADVLYAERFGVIEACVEKDVLAISNMSDQSELGPDHVITGPVWDMSPTVEQAIKLVQAGVFTAQDMGGFSYMAKGGSYLAPLHGFEDRLSDEVKQLLAEKTAEIMSGNYRVEVDESTPKSE
jgi:basic membrane lipoprotein Med (substrate-binding protein (PBP1-ABC) superfamily)